MNGDPADGPVRARALAIFQYLRDLGRLRSPSVANVDQYERRRVVLGSPRRRGHRTGHSRRWVAIHRKRCVA